MKIKIDLSTHGWLGHPLAGFSCKVVPRNKAGLLRTWPLLIVILRISSTHFLQRVRVKIETFSQVAEFFPYKIRKKSMQKGKAAGDLVDLVNL